MLLVFYSNTSPSRMILVLIQRKHLKELSSTSDHCFSLPVTTSLYINIRSVCLQKWQYKTFLFIFISYGYCFLSFTPGNSIIYPGYSWYETRGKNSTGKNKKTQSPNFFFFIYSFLTN